METTPEQSTTKTNFLLQFNGLLSVVSSSLVVKGTIALLVLFYLLSFSDSAADHLTVIPGYVLPPNFWIWTLITHNFLQKHLVMVLVDILVVILSGKLLEPIWAPLQFGIFFLVVCCSSAILTAGAYMFFYSISGNTIYLFETNIYGLGAYIGGFCVVMKQLMPEEILLRLPFGKIQNKHIPLIGIVTTITLSVFGVLNGPYAIHFGFGILASWVYLRFYQKHGNGNKGDMAEDFSFARYVYQFCY